MVDNNKLGNLNIKCPKMTTIMSNILKINKMIYSSKSSHTNKNLIIIISCIMNCPLIILTQPTLLSILHVKMALLKKLNSLFKYGKHYKKQGNRDP